MRARVAVTPVVEPIDLSARWLVTSSHRKVLNRRGDRMPAGQAAAPAAKPQGQAEPFGSFGVLSRVDKPEVASRPAATARVPAASIAGATRPGRESATDTAC